MELKFTLPLPVSINALYVNQYRYNVKTKKNEPTGARVLSKEGTHSKQLITKAAKQQMKKQEAWDMEYTKENYIYMDCIFFFNRKGRDDNNCYKLLCDALEGICYDNDSRVLIRTQRILYDVADPRVEVHIHPVDYAGIFDNHDAMTQFESACMGCKRYARNCSILKAAKEGRIQEEITGDTCSKFNAK